MSNSSQGVMIHAEMGAIRQRKLRDAAEQLETVLQTLDLESESEIADEVIQALRATERAYELEIADNRKTD